MLKDYAKIAWRITVKHKGFAFIKMFGLALAIACCLLAYLHIQSELSYDDFHSQGESTFRIIRVLYNQGDYRVRHKDPSLAGQMGSLLPAVFPEIESQTRSVDFMPGIITSEEHPFRETIHMADASFFRIFSFPLKAGNPDTVLAKDSDIVLTESAARKYFGTRDPIGRRLTISCGDVSKDFFVSGIAADPPKNSIFQFPLILPIGNLPAFLNMPGLFTEWSLEVWPIPVYVLLKPGVRPADLERRFPAFTAQFFEREIQYARKAGWTRPEVPFSFGLQNIHDVYLDSSVYLGKGLTESIILSGIVLLILIMACLNFINLSLGTASFRAKEIGIRKVIGAERRRLIHQFWGEALIAVGIAAGAGIGLAILTLPIFNQLVGKSYTWADFLSYSNAGAVAVLILIAGSLAGAFPSLVMASFQPAAIIRGQFKFSRKKTLTKTLVIFQFVLSAVLIISALVFQKQMRALNGKDLGYRRDGLLAVYTQDNGIESSRSLADLYRDRLGRNPRILSFSACNAAFGLSPAPRQNTDKFSLHWNVVDRDFLRTIGATIVQGEDFRATGATNAGTALVNESFIRALGLDAPVGMTIGQAVAHRGPGFDVPEAMKTLVIRGVAKDFYFAPLAFGVFPAIYYVEPTAAYSRMLIRISASSASETLKFLEQQWRDIRPDKPFTYYFQDEAFSKLLQSERRWSRIVTLCSTLAILLACMGIFGLTSISMNARVKEIGIRKILGAPSGRIIKDAYRDLLGPVAIAIGLAWPLAYFLLRQALQKFPCRIEVPAIEFLIGGILTLMIAAGTTLILIVKAAGASPVSSLRRE